LNVAQAARTMQAQTGSHRKPRLALTRGLTT